MRPPRTQGRFARSAAIRIAHHAPSTRPEVRLRRHLTQSGGSGRRGCGGAERCNARVDSGVGGVDTSMNLRKPPSSGQVRITGGLELSFSSARSSSDTAYSPMTLHTTKYTGGTSKSIAFRSSAPTICRAACSPRQLSAHNHSERRSERRSGRTGCGMRGG